MSAKKDVYVTHPDIKLLKSYFPQIRGVNYNNLRMSNVGSYSASHREASKQIINIMNNFIKNNNLGRMNNLVITDGTCGTGSDVINFALRFKFVNFLDIEKVHCDITRSNLIVYNLCKNTAYLVGDYTKYAHRIQQDFIYIDPPWGGKSYLEEKSIRLKLGNKDVIEFANELINKNICKAIFIKLPVNANIDGAINYKVHPIMNKGRISFNLLVITQDRLSSK